MSDKPDWNEGENPFDRYLSTETRKKTQELKATQDFQEVQTAIRRVTGQAWTQAHLHEKEWAQHQERQHQVRLEEAQGVVPVEVQQELQLNQLEQDRLDDEKYSWIVCWDQLLQLRDHEEYLRARRSFERRRRRAKETGKPIPIPWTVGRIWSIGTLIVYIVLVLGATSQNVLGGIFLGLVLFPIWALLSNTPGFLGGIGSGSYGRGSGGAV